VHVFSGLLMLGLILYRVTWGVVGSRYARFSSFMFSPVTAFQYLLATLQQKADRHIGHNPAGSWAIYLLLSLGAGISVAGLATLIAGEQFKDIHEVLANGALAIVAVHIIGVIAASFLHRENLPRAMVTGRKEGEADQAIPSSRLGSAIVLLILVAAFSLTYWKGWNPQTESVSLPFLSQPLALGERDKEKERGHTGKHREHDD